MGATVYDQKIQETKPANLHLHHGADRKMPDPIAARRTLTAPSRLCGGAQMPGPASCIAP
jgi:hypothetical protein